MKHKNWDKFISGDWNNTIKVSNFIKLNYREYTGDYIFLETSTQRTTDVMKKVNKLFDIEREFCLLNFFIRLYLKG